jgi:exodeoxyribonuclease-3
VVTQRFYRCQPEGLDVCFGPIVLWFAGSRVTVARVLVGTWNVNSLKARIPRVEQWLDEVAPDVLCLQETKLAADAFPDELFTSRGYGVAHHGLNQWNGVAVISRLTMQDPIFGFAPGLEPDPDARIVSVRCGTTLVVSVYVPNGRSVDDDHYQYKLSWLERLRLHLDAIASPDDDVIVAGDWNIAPTDADVWDAAAFAGSTHVTPAERQALDSVKAWGLRDTFRERHDEAGLFSYYDYQAGRFHKREGMRIDYILSTAALADRAVLDVVDRNARKGTKPSDHAPVLTLFAD